MNLRQSITVLLSLFMLKSFGQDLPNLSNLSRNSPGTEAAIQFANIPVDLFHGTPNISIPIFTYSKDNFNLGISMNYQPGIKRDQNPTDFGYGWFLQAGGCITRIVRGAPDDLQSGYLYQTMGTLNHLDSFYNSTNDQQQDVFNFNFCGRTGKFFIGKDKSVTCVPLQNLKIIPEFKPYPLNYKIYSFKVVTEDGTQYHFNDIDNCNSYNPMDTYAYLNSYTTSWYLSQVILPFSTDTIKFSYANAISDIQYSYPQVGYYYTSTGVKQNLYTPTGTNVAYVEKINTIKFPGNKKVDFYYDYIYRSSGTNPTLKRIEISDSIFRRGYIFFYDTTTTGIQSGNGHLNIITPYFQNESGRSYQFTYDTLPNTQFKNNEDYWGYYNSQVNLSLMPFFLPDTTHRGIDLASTKTNTMKTAFIPGKGLFTYDYESNDRPSYTKSQQNITISASTTSTTSVTFNQVFNQRHRLVFNYNSLAARIGSVPASLTVNLQWYIKSTDLATTYVSGLINIDTLFYLGTIPVDFNLSNGNYKLVTSLTGGSITGAFNIDINWENRTESSGNTLLGGLRIKNITVQSAASDSASYSIHYKYIREDGKSSGFIGDTLLSSYRYKEVNPSGTLLNDYTVLSSLPIDDIPGNQFVPSYNRIEVTEGPNVLKSGKTVYEYYDVKDANTNLFSSTVPFAPQDIKDWALGAPKKVTIYDSSGRKIKTTSNIFTLVNRPVNATNNKSLSLLQTGAVINGGTTTNVYSGNLYSFTTGKLLLSSSTDTSFFADGSSKTSNTSYTYDSVYFNLKKITTPYNNALGLSLEKRLYYPYDYSNVYGAVGVLRDSGIIFSPIGTEEWIVGDANPRILEASVTDFQQLSSGYLKPHTSYFLQSNKPVPEATFGAFNTSYLIRNTNYLKPAITYDRYDNKGNLLQETNSITGISNCTIMGYGQTLAVATVSNANYVDIAYTGFEGDSTGNWVVSDTSRYRDNFLTGKTCFDLNKGTLTKSGLDPAKTYVVSYWCGKGPESSSGTYAASINGILNSTVISTANLGAGKTWNYFYKTVTGVSSIVISGTVAIDEVRLYPVNANMQSATYEPNVGITSTDDANSNLIFYEYDEQSRPYLMRDKDRNILKKTAYSDVKYYIPGQVGAGGTGTHTGVPPVVHCLSGPQYKVVNGSCETGIRHNLSSTLNGSTYECDYRWDWSDGSYSTTYVEYNTDPCEVF